MEINAILYLLSYYLVYYDNFIKTKNITNIKMGRGKSRKQKTDSCESHPENLRINKLKANKIKSRKAKIHKLFVDLFKVRNAKINKAVLLELEALKGRISDLESKRIVLDGLEINPRYAAARKVTREKMITAPFQFSPINVNYLSAAVLPILTDAVLPILTDELLMSDVPLFAVENLSVTLTLDASVGQVKSLQGLGLIVYMVPALDDLDDIPEFFALNFDTTAFDKVDLSGSTDLSNHVFFNTIISNNNGSAVLTNGNTVLTLEEMDALANKQRELTPIPMEGGELFYNQIYTFLRTDVEPIESEENNKNLVLLTDPAILPASNSSFLAS